MSTTSKKKELVQITSRFYENLYSLRILNEQIGQMAEEYDQSIEKQFASSITDLVGSPNNKIDLTGDAPFEALQFKFNPESPESTLLELATVHNENEQTDDVNRSEDSLLNTAPASTGGKVVVEIADQQQFTRLFMLLRNARKYSPRQSRLLRQGALISLVSYFESLEADLLNFYYLSYPSALPSEGKLLSLADLREIGSVEEAEKVLILKEVDSFLRESTENQIEYFTKRFKVDLKCTQPYFNALLEVILRRNLVVHNERIVNRLYIKKVDSEIIRNNNIKEGDQLAIDGEYLTSAIDTICIFGTMLIQQSWRKWDEKNIEDADTVLREYTYDLLVEKRWEVVNKVAHYASSLNFGSDASTRIIKINQAIALKEQNKLTEMNALLDRQDWSSCALRFHVARYALKEQYDQLVPLLDKAVANEEIDKHAILEWPLFRWFRESHVYESVFPKLFPE